MKKYDFLKNFPKKHVGNMIFEEIFRNENSAECG